MKQSEKLLKLKDAGTILINLGILIMCGSLRAALLFKTGSKSNTINNNWRDK